MARVPWVGAFVKGSRHLATDTFWMRRDSGIEWQGMTVTSTRCRKASPSRFDDPVALVVNYQALRQMVMEPDSRNIHPMVENGGIYANSYSAMQPGVN